MDKLGRNSETEMSSALSSAAWPGFESKIGAETVLGRTEWRDSSRALSSKGTAARISVNDFAHRPIRVCVCVCLRRSRCPPAVMESTLVAGWAQQLVVPSGVCTKQENRMSAIGRVHTNACCSKCLFGGELEEKIDTNNVSSIQFVASTYI